MEWGFTPDSNDGALSFLPGRVYQAAPGREADLAAELAAPEAPEGLSLGAAWDERASASPFGGVNALLPPETDAFSPRDRYQGRAPGPPETDAFSPRDRYKGRAPGPPETDAFSPRDRYKGRAPGPLVYRACPPSHPVYWWRNLWEAPFVFSFSSIKKAAAVLRSIQRNWVCVPQGYYGRARLIKEALPPISEKRRPLDYILPAAPMGSWTLVDEHTILASARCASPFPGGIIEFEEDKEGPPSRAYLKLAEAFIRLGRCPAAGETCFDAGASPGGWTWMVSRISGVSRASRSAETGSTPPRIIACDRAPLAPSVAALSHVTFLRHDAFTLRPEDIGAIDWLFCDAACYPERLYRWIEKWLASGLCKNYVCTIKMQGSGDMKTARLFAAVPGSTVVHLYHNKHELTWMLCSVV